jgi:hypothetical protein
MKTKLILGDSSVIGGSRGVNGQDSIPCEGRNFLLITTSKPLYPIQMVPGNFCLGLKRAELQDYHQSSPTAELSRA